MNMLLFSREFSVSRYCEQSATVTHECSSLRWSWRDWPAVIVLLMVWALVTIKIQYKLCWLLKLEKAVVYGTKHDVCANKDYLWTPLSQSQEGIAGLLPGPLVLWRRNAYHFFCWPSEMLPSIWSFWNSFKLPMTLLYCFQENWYLQNNSRQPLPPKTDKPSVNIRRVWATVVSRQCSCIPSTLKSWSYISANSDNEDRLLA